MILLIDDIDYFIIETLLFHVMSQILTSLVHNVTSYYCLKVVKFRTLPNQPFGRKFKLPFETRFVKNGHDLTLNDVISEFWHVVI